MTDLGDTPLPAGSLDELALEAGGVRIAGGALHLGAGVAPIPLADVVWAEETASPKTPSQILTIIAGCLVLLVTVPSAMMCPLALMGIPLGAKVLSKALHDQENSFALRLKLRVGEPVVVKFGERRHGVRVEEALAHVIDARSRAPHA